MKIGIDLGIRNLSVYTGRQWVNFDVQDHGDFLNFVDSVTNLTCGLNCYVDFSWNEIYLPGKRKDQALKYFIAGAIRESAFDCTFVNPGQIREMIGLSARVPKREVHRTAKILYPELQNANSQHEIDAWLLWKWGCKNG